MKSFSFRRISNLPSLSLVPRSSPICIPKRSFLIIVNEYEKAVVFTLGKFSSVKSAGLRIFLPSFQQLYKVDMRTRVVELSPQDVITKDNVSASINAVVYFRAINAKDVVLNVDQVESAVVQLGQTQLRDLMTTSNFNTILENRDQLSNIMAEKMQLRCERWGVKIEHLQVKQIDLINEDMVRAMAKQAEASREKIASLIRADGEVQAALKLTEAAKVLHKYPIAVELRRLQTLERLAQEPSQKTIIIPNDVMTDHTALIGCVIAASQSHDNPLLGHHTVDFSGSDGLTGDERFVFPNDKDSQVNQTRSSISTED